MLATGWNPRAMWPRLEKAPFWYWISTCKSILCSAVCRIGMNLCRIGMSLCLPFCHQLYEQIFFILILSVLFVGLDWIELTDYFV